MATKFYMLGGATGNKGRDFPSHGFTPQTLRDKRWKENTSAAAVSLNFVLPFLNSFNAKLEQHVEEGTNVSAAIVVNHLRDCGAIAAVNYSDVIARVFVQYVVAVALINHKTAWSDSVVYLWDAYPRMHRKYLGDVCDKLYIPKFISSLFGVQPSAKDLATYDTKVGFVHAFEDSLKRHALTTIADITVGNARIVITATVTALKTKSSSDADEKKKQKSDVVSTIVVPMAAMTAQKVIVFTGRALGAAAGNYGGGVGEYWGEMMGGLIAAPLAASVLSKFVAGSKKTKKQ